MLGDNTLSSDRNDWASCFVWLTWYLFFDLKDDSGISSWSFVYVYNNGGLF